MALRQQLCALITLTAALAPAACGDDTPAADMGVPQDAGARDTGGPNDTGSTDTGSTDTGSADAGADAGATDSGSPDAGSMDGGAPGTLEIEGVWASNFGTEEVISATRFNRAAIPYYDNAANVLVTQNSTAAEFNPGLFNRVVWTEIQSDRFYYCIVDFGLPSEAAARGSMMTADASDPDNGGCGGFPWTRLRRAISIRGRYMSNFGGMETVTATIWQQMGPPMRLTDWDETTNVVITQNDAEAMFNPSLYNKIEFTEPDPSGRFYYCFVDFGLMTEAEAQTSSTSADASDPETAGCGGFPWTRLDPL